MGGEGATEWIKWDLSLNHAYTPITNGMSFIRDWAALLGIKEFRLNKLML
jgi:hypothetical protein